MENYNKSKNLLSELTDNVWVIKIDIELFIIIVFSQHQQR